MLGNADAAARALTSALSVPAPTEAQEVAELEALVSKVLASLGDDKVSGSLVREGAARLPMVGGVHQGTRIWVVGSRGVLGTDGGRAGFVGELSVQRNAPCGKSGPRTLLLGPFR